MSISTTLGDDGTTSLYSNEKVSKSNVRVEAYGTLDELDAFLSDARHHVSRVNKEMIKGIQKILPRLMGELATIGNAFPDPITNEDVEYISNYVYSFEKAVNPVGLQELGQTISSAKLNICRTIARRAERKIVALNEMTSVSTHILALINRLSDLLFLMTIIEENK